MSETKPENVHVEDSPKHDVPKPDTQSRTASEHVKAALKKLTPHRILQRMARRRNDDSETNGEYDDERMYKRERVPSPEDRAIDRNPDNRSEWLQGQLDALENDMARGEKAQDFFMHDERKKQRDFMDVMTADVVEPEPHPNEEHFKLGRAGRFFSTEEPLTEASFLRPRHYDGRGVPVKGAVYAEFVISDKEQKGKAGETIAIIGDPRPTAEEEEPILYAVRYEPSEHDARVRVMTTRPERLITSGPKELVYGPGESTLRFRRKGEDVFVEPTNAQTEVEVTALPVSRKTSVKNVARHTMDIPKRVWDKRKKIMATAVLGGALAMNGGPIDSAILDPLNNAHDTVISWGQEDFKDSSVSKPWERVAQTMGDLDEHNYEEIIERGQKYVEDHADQFQPSEKVNATMDAIDAANDEKELLASLNEYLSFYGKSAATLTKIDRGDQVSAEYIQLYKHENFDRLKKYAKSVVQSMDDLPKDFVKNEMNFDKVEFAGNVNGNSSFAGYFEGRDSLVISVDSSLVDKAQSILTPDSQVIHHEEGHSEGVQVDPENVGSPLTGLNYFRQKYWGGADDVSFRGAMGGDEETRAEVVRRTIEGDVEHPDNVRGFTSGGNKMVITFLKELDAMAGAGVSDYIVAQQLTKGHLRDNIV